MTTKKKEPINLAAIQSRIRSDRSITTEDEAREKFWTPTDAPQKDKKEDNMFNKYNVEELEYLKYFQIQINQERNLIRLH